MNTLAEIRERGKRLTKRQLEVLQIMADNEHDGYKDAIMVDRGEVWLGDTRIVRRIFTALLRACAISKSQRENYDIEYYYINETGENILKAKRGV